MILTDDYKEAERMYELMCFNVFSHNRDDHSKNFSYIFDEEKRKWTLSPAYDLTYSSSLGGEHATMVAGNGKNPGLKELVTVGENIGLKKDYCVNTANRIREQVYESLEKHLKNRVVQI